VSDLKSWERPRIINIIIDNDSWILPWSERLAVQLRRDGDEVHIIRRLEDVKAGSVAFYIGCLHITPPDILARNLRNLVIHASDLPLGRGFSPWTWMILEGHTDIPVCLIEAAEKVDSGSIIYKDYIALEGHELINEIRTLIGDKTVELCTRFINAASPPTGVSQVGEATWYRRRYPIDNEIDPNKSLQDIFNQMRVADNDSFPVFFKLNGKTYNLKIEKVKQ
jgi:methionyl-tRNA formyltransferase